jgi:cyanophycin synthetase
MAATVFDRLLEKTVVSRWLLLLLRGGFMLREWYRQRRLGATALGSLTPYVDLWRCTAAAVSAEFVALPGGLCELRLGERTTRTWDQLVMLDDPVTLRIAGDKALVHQLLASHGLPVPSYRQFHWSRLDAADAFLRLQRQPCVVKPRNGTGGGAGVTTGVRTARDLALAAAQAAMHGTELLIEAQAPGDSYRLLYLDGTLLDAVRRHLPRVRGDGRSTIAQLIAQENRRRARVAGRAVVDSLPADLDCRWALRAAGWSLRSVPPAGREVVVRGATRWGGETDNESVRALLGEALIAEGARAAAALGVRLAGVDIITTDPRVGLRQSGGVINEVNTTPGLHYHYQVRNHEAMVPVAAVILRSLLASHGPPQEVEVEARACNPR